MPTMYSLKPIIRHDISTDRQAKCMYEMKNIHGNGHPRQECRIALDHVSEQVINFLKSPLPEVAALEVRQEKILAQLKELKEQVLNLCDVLKDNSQSQGKCEIPTAQRKRVAVSADLVINVNPSNPAYSIRVLQKLWSHVDFRIEPFVHSSIKGQVPEGFEKTSTSAKDGVINLSFIWKKVNDTELVISGTQGHSIHGEVNVLRYLSRLVDDYDHLPIEESLKIDRILDLSHQLLYLENAKDKQATLNTLDQKIGKNAWFAGTKAPGIADVAVWSSLKQTSSKSLPSNLTTFFQKCEKTFIN